MGVVRRRRVRDVRVGGEMEWVCRLERRGC